MKRLEKDLLIEKAEAVLNRLTHLENQEFGDDVDPWKGFASRDFGIKPWDWPQGVGLYGMEKLQTYYKDKRFDSFFETWVLSNVEEGLPSANINTTAPYTMLYALSTRSKDDTYKKMCEERVHWLMKELPKTKEGGFQHVTTDIYDKNGIILNENQLWVDTLFMAVLFLAKMGVGENNQAWIDEAVYQIMLHIKYLYDKETGLFYHGWTFENNNNFGGIFWGRGNSWFTYGILELLEILENNLPESLKKYIQNTFTAQVESLEKLQADSGLWHTVLTDKESYQEVSATAAIAAGIYKGIRMGVLDEKYQECADKALLAVIDNIEPDGTVINVSGGTSIGMDADHYKNIIIGPMPYGQSMALLALIEALEFYN